MGRWVAVVTPHGVAKRDAVEAILARAASAGVPCAAFAQERVDDGSGDRAGYDLVERSTGRRLVLARRSSAPEVCDLAFSPHVFAHVRETIARDAPRVVVLELGRLEAAGGGHTGAVEQCLRGDQVAVLLVRPQVLAAIALRMPDPADAIELPASDDELDRLASAVVTLARAA